MVEYNATYPDTVVIELIIANKSPGKFNILASLIDWSNILLLVIGNLLSNAINLLWTATSSFSRANNSPFYTPSNIYTLLIWLLNYVSY